MRGAAGQRGAALTIVLALVVLLAVVGLAMVDNALTDVTIASNQGFGLAATYLAEAGVSDTVNEILTHGSGTQIGVTSCPAIVTAATVTSTPTPVRALQGTLEGGTYRVCVEKSGTTRVIVSTGRAQHALTDPDDNAAAVKTVRYAVRVIPSNFTYTILALKTVDLIATTVGAITYAPVVIQTFPPDRPMAVRAGPTPPNNQNWVTIQAGTQITGGLDVGGTYTLQPGATDPCKPTGIWECEVPSGGPTFPTFNVRINDGDPSNDTTSYEYKARNSPLCGADSPPSKDGCYFSTEAAFRSWVLGCPPTCYPALSSGVDGRVLGPGIFFINATTVIDAPLNIKEIIGSFVLGQNNLQIDAGFTYKPCTDPNNPESCSEPALVVNKNLVFTGTAINQQCRNVLIEGMLYLESQDFNIQYAPDVTTGPDCDAGQAGVQKPVVRFGMIVSKEDVKLHGQIRVEFNPALLDSLPPGLLGSTSSTPLVLPLGWMSK